MASFTIRVELHDATWQNYVDMAKDLAGKGINDVITSDKGVRYRMSPAEYNYVGNASIDDVLNAAQASAAKTGKTHAVLVTEAQQRKWNGLKVIK